MSLTLDTKQRIVEQVSKVAAQVPCAIAAEYSGLTVAEMTSLRQTAREAQVHIQVMRNTLARRAFENTPLACMRDGMVGPLLLAFSGNEPGSAARVLRDFSKDNEKLVVKQIAMNGKLLDVSELETLANLPSLDQGRAMLLGLLSTPMIRFVRAMAEPQAKLVRLLGARRDRDLAESKN